MAVAAVGVAVGGERGQRRSWVATTHEESVAVPVEQACMAGEECGRRRQGRGAGHVHTVVTCSGASTVVRRG